jgi:hypothetical protein
MQGVRPSDILVILNEVKNLYPGLLGSVSA